MLVVAVLELAMLKIKDFIYLEAEDLVVEVLAQKQYKAMELLILVAVLAHQLELETVALE
jgi:hypothetical protein